MVSHAHNVSSQGKYIAIVSTTVETDKPINELQPGLALLGRILERWVGLMCVLYITVCAALYCAVLYSTVLCCALLYAVLNNHYLLCHGQFTSLNHPIPSTPHHFPHPSSPTTLPSLTTVPRTLDSTPTLISWSLWQTVWRTTASSPRATMRHRTLRQPLTMFWACTEELQVRQ